MSSWDTNPWNSFFVTLTQNSSVATNETQKPRRSIFSNAGENAKEDCWCEKWKKTTSYCRLFLKKAGLSSNVTLCKND